MFNHLPYQPLWHSYIRTKCSCLAFGFRDSAADPSKTDADVIVEEKSQEDRIRLPKLFGNKFHQSIGKGWRQPNHVIMLLSHTWLGNS